MKMRDMNVGVTKEKRDAYGNVVAFGGRYEKPKNAFRGVVVFDSKKPRCYLTEEGKGSDAWIPYIGVAFPQNKKALTVSGNGVYSKDAVFFEYYFEPSWNGRLEHFENHEKILTLENSFVPEDKESVTGNVVIRRTAFNLSRLYFTSRGTKAVNPSVGYSSNEHKRTIYHGKEEELEDILKNVISKMNFRGSYDLTISYPCCANSENEYKIHLNDIETLSSEIVKDVRKPASEKKWID